MIRVPLGTAAFRNGLVSPRWTNLRPQPRSRVSCSIDRFGSRHDFELRFDKAVYAIHRPEIFLMVCGRCIGFLHRYFVRIEMSRPSIRQPTGGNCGFGATIETVVRSPALNSQLTGPAEVLPPASLAGRASSGSPRSANLRFVGRVRQGVLAFASLLRFLRVLSASVANGLFPISGHLVTFVPSPLSFFSKSLHLRP